MNTKFVHKLQSTAKVEPPLGESIVETIKTYRKEEMENTKQFVQVGEFRLPKDFFTCFTVALINLNDPKIDEVLDAFGFKMQDADGKPLFPRVKNSKKAKKSVSD